MAPNQPQSDADREAAIDVALQLILDDSLDAEDTARLERARKHAAAVLADVESSPTKGPLKRDLNDNESMLAWAVDYLSDVIVGMKGVLSSGSSKQLPQERNSTDSLPSTTQASASSEERSGVGVVEALEIMKAAHSEIAEHPDSIALRAWQQVFGTTQLTHARARLEAAEAKAANGGSGALVAGPDEIVITIDAYHEFLSYEAECKLRKKEADATEESLAQARAAPSPDGKEEKR